MSVEVFLDERFIARQTELVRLKLEIPERKCEFNLLPGRAPPVILDLGHELAEDLGREPNTAIFKRYTLGEPSQAYDWHPEPDRFIGDVAAHALNNMTWLYFRRRRPIEFWSGMTAVWSAADEHMVEEPQRGNFRDILFYGYDSTKAA